MANINSEKSLPRQKDQPLQNSIVAPGISIELQQNLNRIVGDIVNNFGYVGAMVATLEPDDSLPVRAYAVDTSPKVLEFIKMLETKFDIGFISPKSVAYLNDPKFKDNLSVRAIKGNNGQPDIILSDNLHDLFRPVLNKMLSKQAQKIAGIKQVIAVPFFIEDEVVGNLFVASHDEFADRDIGFLNAFGRQAATAIQSQRHLAETQALERVIFDLQASIDNEIQVLQIIVDAVVHKLGYVGAMVATLEPDDSLPVRAYAVDTSPKVLEFIKMLETKFDIGFISPKSVAYLNDPKFKDNLSVRAIKGNNGQPDIVLSDNLHDLFRPVLNKFLSNQGQKLAGIKQVIAVPFFLDDEVVGNLFAASRRTQFTAREIEILRAFGQQAAVGIRNARLYRKSEERRRVAQLFGKMAFSSAAYVHELRNHIGAFRMYAQMTQAQLNETFKQLGNGVIERLDVAADILDNLHEPWRQQPDTPTNVNSCLKQAINKIIGDPDELRAKEGITLETMLAEDLPAIKTSPDMMAEAFRVLLKNALEAIKDSMAQTGKIKEGFLKISTRYSNNSIIWVEISDSGIGIKPDDLSKIFEMRWSTKNSGMGFGLFWAKDYITGLGGEIDVESAWQQGTNFYISLPVSVEAGTK